MSIILKSFIDLYKIGIPAIISHIYSMKFYAVFSTQKSKLVNKVGGENHQKIRRFSWFMDDPIAPTQQVGTDV